MNIHSEAFLNKESTPFRGDKSLAILSSYGQRRVHVNVFPIKPSSPQALTNILHSDWPIIHRIANTKKSDFSPTTQNTNITKHDNNFQYPVKEPILSRITAKLSSPKRHSSSTAKDLVKQFVRGNKFHGFQGDNDDSYGNITENTGTTVSDITVKEDDENDDMYLVAMKEAYEVDDDIISVEENANHEYEEKENLDEFNSESAAVTVLDYSDDDRSSDEEILCYLEHEESVYDAMGILRETSVSSYTEDDDECDFDIRKSNLLLHGMQRDSMALAKEKEVNERRLLQPLSFSFEQNNGVKDIESSLQCLTSTTKSFDEDSLFSLVLQLSFSSEGPELEINEKKECSESHDDDIVSECDNDDYTHEDEDTDDFYIMKLLLQLAGVDKDIISSEVDLLERRDRIVYPFFRPESTGCSFFFFCK